MLAAVSVYLSSHLITEWTVMVRFPRYKLFHVLPPVMTQNKVVAGLCPFAGRITVISLFNLTIDELDYLVCSNESRRDGRLCGRCQDGHGLAINTFGLECISDTHCNSYNWAIYFAIHFTVLSVFFLFVVTFNVKGTAECASSFTLFAQVITLPFNLVTIQRDWAVQMGFTHSRRFPEAFAWAVDFVYGHLESQRSIRSNIQALS